MHSSSLLSMDHCMQPTKILRDMLRQGLVEKVTPNSYRITLKGRIFVALFTKEACLVPEFDGADLA